MNYNWNWGVLFDLTPSGQETYLEFLFMATGWTLAVSGLSLIIALVVGSTIGVMRSLDSRVLSSPARAYVEIFRNIPLLVQLFLWYFVVPELLPTQLGMALKQSPHSAFIAAVICLGLYTSPRIAEQLKSGLQSLGRGQKMAGLAMGLTLTQTYRYIILPVAYRIIIPPLTSEFLSIIKNSAVALTIGLVELTGAARSMQEFTFQIFEAFAAATVVYMLINIVVVSFMRVVERKAALPGFAGYRASK